MIECTVLMDGANKRNEGGSECVYVVCVCKYIYIVCVCGKRKQGKK